MRFTDPRIAFLAICMWGLWCGTPAHAADTSLVTLNTRAGVTQKFMLIKPDRPVASVILFAGGGGLLGLTQGEDGSVVIGALTGNFLVRTRQAYVDQGFMVAVVDVPSSHPEGIGLFRGSPEHAQDIAAVVTYMRQQAQLPVWLIGTSAGSQSAASIAVRSTQGIGGVVLTSSVTLVSDITIGVLSLALESIHVPGFVLAHEQDLCADSPPADAQRILDRMTGAPAKSLTLITGGLPPASGPCNGSSAHGFYGVETQAVNAITGFISRNSPHSFAGVASGPVSARVLNVAVQPALADLGGTRQIFVAAMVGTQLYFRTPLGWQAWGGGGYPAYSEGVLLAGQNLALLDGSIDLSGLVGARIFVGYGTDSSEMMASRRFALVHTVQ